MELVGDKEVGTWLGTLNAGIERMDPKTDEVRRYSLEPTGSTGLANDRSTAITECTSRLIWDGTDSGGTNRVPASNIYGVWKDQAVTMRLK